MNRKISRWVLALMLLGFLQTLPACGGTTEGKKGLLPLGSQAPDFSLKDVVTGKVVSLADFSDKKALVVIFMCRHCPYVQHVKKEIARLGEDYSAKGMGLVGISANDPAAYPDDAPESLAEMAKSKGFMFPLLFDEAQEVAQAYTAACTPDVFVFDKARKLVYRGQFDDSRPFGPKASSGKDVREAVEAVLNDRPVSPDQKPAVGCSIKWKPGNEPA